MNVVFDLGNVLIRWQPHLAFDFASEAEWQDWARRAGFAEWNLEQDRGRSFAEGLTALPTDLAAPLRDYPARFGDTIRDPVPGTWELLERLLAGGHATYAITNWGRETWPAALALHPRLGASFRDIVVSGIEQIIKPDPAIYRLLLERNGLSAGECLFIDDSPRNVAGAHAVGMDAVLFTDAQTLARDLSARDLL